MVKKLLANAGNIRDLGLIPGWGRSPGGEHGTPLQYSCLDNHMDRGAWRAMVYRVTKSQTQPTIYTQRTKIKMVHPKIKNKYIKMN